MVNKIAVGLVVVIVITSLGVGVLVGMQQDGDADTTTNTSPSSNDGKATAGDETDAPSSTETATPAATPTEQRTTIPARQFDEQAIASHVAKFVNQERVDQGRSELETGGTTATSVAGMADDHSVAMADAGNVTHTIDGVSTAARYKNHDLFERCKFKSPEGSYISQPDEEFELIGMTYAGSHYTDDGEAQFNGDERAVARAIVNDWNKSSKYSERLLLNGPTRMGVGIEVTAGGTVFATVDLCA